ncbi:MAG TPA: enoyl-CoA hydratase [Stellaceae bacterium]|nr:enoyl-CoA hydratase [Stellaceae bacterium]
MSEPVVLYDVKDRIAIITFNRPDRLNAFNAEMAAGLRQAMEKAARDEGVRVIILTGAGRGFCAGADMERLSGTVGSGGANLAREAPPPALEVGGSRRPDFQQRYSYFPSIPKPVIAAVNGPAAGLGFIFACYCDIRFAGSEAIFTTAFSRRGLIAEYGLAWLLPRLVGPAHAADLLYSARRVSADEATRIGLVNRTVPQAKLMDEVRAYASELASAVSPRSMGVMKRQLWEGLLSGLGEAIDLANGEMPSAFKSEDFREGVAHFVEKRPARFTGR